ncbi:MAG TPA: pyridoxamine 5'-phosphate oxidase [Candidatus Kapabacteria bacterium]|nr:pyridoxamine 5'-phosphate oxidase [Candidatus Kapabacteria bacterium]
MKELQQHIYERRREYSAEKLSEQFVLRDPLKQFGVWLQEAIDAELPEPTAMVLSTVAIDGTSSSRVVLLRGFDEKGFTFFTNYHSRKGMQIEQNPNASLLFFWPELHRQVRIEGAVQKLSAKESDDYFQSRPRESQISAWASHQSKRLQSREELDVAFAKYSEEFKDTPVPRPPHWGGFCLVPEGIEFWHGRPSRLHDRLLFEMQESGEWKMCRLAP